MKLRLPIFSLIVGTLSIGCLDAESLWIAGKGGIFHSELNAETGALTEPTLGLAYGSGSFLAIHPTLDVIYTSFNDKPDFGYASLVPTGESGKLEMQSKQLVESGAPSHLSVASDGTLLAGVHYGAQSCNLFALNTDGSIAESPLQITQSGNGPRRAQQQSRPHWSSFSDNDSVFHNTDLGSDEVWSYQVNRNPFSVELLHKVKFPLGTGPRHMAFDPKNEYAYVCGEISLDVTTLHYDRKSHRFSPTQHIGTVAEGEGSNRSSLSEIQVHANGKFVYAAVRGNNLIVAYRIDPATGLLSLVERQDSIVKRPRNFTVSASGNWLIAAGQDSSDLAVFAIDPDSGALEPNGVTVSVPNPVCVRAWNRL